MTKQEHRSGNSSAIMVSLEKYGPWGFNYEDVTLPVHFFHGDKDTMVPLAAVQAVSSKMPNSQLTVYPDATHNIMADLEVQCSIFKSLAESLSVETKN